MHYASSYKPTTNDIVINRSEQPAPKPGEPKARQEPTNQHEKAYCQYNAYGADIIDTPLFREMPLFIVSA